MCSWLTAPPRGSKESQEGVGSTRPPQTREPPAPRCAAEASGLEPTAETPRCDDSWGKPNPGSSGRPQVLQLRGGEPTCDLVSAPGILTRDTQRAQRAAHRPGATCPTPAQREADGSGTHQGLRGFAICILCSGSDGINMESCPRMQWSWLKLNSRGKEGKVTSKPVTAPCARDRVALLCSYLDRLRPKEPD